MDIDEAWQKFRSSATPDSTSVKKSGEVAIKGQLDTILSQLNEISTQTKMISDIRNEIDAQAKEEQVQNSQDAQDEEMMLQLLGLGGGGMGMGDGMGGEQPVSNDQDMTGEGGDETLRSTNQDTSQATASASDDRGDEMTEEDKLNVPEEETSEEEAPAEEPMPEGEPDAGGEEMPPVDEGGEDDSYIDDTEFGDDSELGEYGEDQPDIGGEGGSGLDRAKEAVKAEAQRALDEGDYEAAKEIIGALESIDNYAGAADEGAFDDVPMDEADEGIGEDIPVDDEDVGGEEPLPEGEDVVDDLEGNEEDVMGEGGEPVGTEEDLPPQGDEEDEDEEETEKSASVEKNDDISNMNDISPEGTEPTAESCKKSASIPSFKDMMNHIRENPNESFYKGYVGIKKSMEEAEAFSEESIAKADSGHIEKRRSVAYLAVDPKNPKSKLDKDVLEENMSRDSAGWEDEEKEYSADAKKYRKRSELATTDKQKKTYENAANDASRFAARAYVKGKKAKDKEPDGEIGGDKPKYPTVGGSDGQETEHDEKSGFNDNEPDSGQNTNSMISEHGSKGAKAGAGNSVILGSKKIASASSKVAKTGGIDTIESADKPRQVMSHKGTKDPNEIAQASEPHPPVHKEEGTKHSIQGITPGAAHTDENEIAQASEATTGSAHSEEYVGKSGKRIPTMRELMGKPMAQSRPESISTANGDYFRNPDNTVKKSASGQGSERMSLKEAGFKKSLEADWADYRAFKNQGQI